MKRGIVKSMMLAVFCIALSANLFATPCAVTYVWPVAGSTAPTAAQARQHNSVVADVVFTDVATACVVTHNMQLPNATGANGIPKIVLTITAAGAVASVPFVAFTNATSITVDKNLTTATSSLSVRVTIERPSEEVK